MQAYDDMLICVQREWDGWRTAFVHLADMRDVHWHQPPGAPKPLIHGYISCADIVAGALPHECHETPAPHRLLVCALSRHSASTAYAELARRAPQRGARPSDMDSDAALLTLLPSACDIWLWPATTTRRSRPTALFRTLR